MSRNRSRKKAVSAVKQTGLSTLLCFSYRQPGKDHYIHRRVRLEGLLLPLRPEYEFAVDRAFGKFCKVPEGVYSISQSFRERDEDYVGRISYSPEDGGCAHVEYRFQLTLQR